MIAGTLEIQMLANMARLADDMNKAKGLVGGAMDSIEKSVASAKAALGALGVGLGVGYFASLIKGSIDAADHLNDLSKTTGIAVEDLAGLRLLANQTGTDLDGLAKGIDKMSVAIGKEPEKFKALGITAKDNAQAFGQLADIFNAIPDINQRNALAQSIFNKSWAELAPALTEGSKGIAKAMELGTQLSGVTKEMAVQSDALNDKWAALTTTGGLFTRIVGPALPLLNALADDLLDTQKKAVSLNDGGFSPLLETLKALVVVAGNVSFVLHAVANEIGGIAAQISRLVHGDIAGFNAIHKQMISDAKDSRAAFDAWEQKIMALGTAADKTGKTIVDSTNSANDAEIKSATEKANAFIKATEIEAAKKKAAEEAAAAAKKDLEANQEYMRTVAEVGNQIYALNEIEQTNIQKLQKKLDLMYRVPQALRDWMQGALDNAKAIEQENEWHKINTETIDREIEAQTELENAERAAADARDSAQTNLAAQMLREEEDLNASIIYDDKTRVIAQINLERQRREDYIRSLDDQTEAGHAATEALLEDSNRIYDKKVAQVYAQEQKKVWDSIESTAHDTFISIFDSGKSAFDRLRDALKNGLLDLLYQMTLKKWIVSIGATITGSSSGSALADSVSGGSTSFGGIGNVLSSFSKGFDVANATFEQSIKDFGGVISNLGSPGGLVDKFGSFVSLNSATVSNVLPFLPAAFSLLKGDFKGAALQGGGAALGMAIGGPVGAGIGAAVGTLVNGLLGGGHKETHAYANTLLSASGISTVDSRITTGRAGGAGGDGLGISSGQSIAKTIQSLTTALGGSLGKAFQIGTMYNSKYDAYAVTVGRQISGARNSADLYFNANNSANGVADAFLTSVKRGLVKLPDYLQTIVQRSVFNVNNSKAAVDALSVYSRLNDSLKDLPPVFKAIDTSIKSIATTNNVAKIAAQFDAINTYTALFYTDAEKTATASKQLSTQFKALGLDLPDTRDGFRALVDGIDTTKASNLDLFNSLVALAPSLDSYYTALQNQANATDQAAQSAQQLADALSTDKFKTLVDYTRAQNYIKNGYSTAGIPGFATGTDSFAGGLRMVGENGPEIEATGPSKIISNSELMQRLTNPSANSDALLGEVRRLTKLNSDMYRELHDLKVLTADSHRINDKWDGEGMPPVRT